MDKEEREVLLDSLLLLSQLLEAELERSGWKWRNDSPYLEAFKLIAFKLNITEPLEQFKGY